MEKMSLEVSPKQSGFTVPTETTLYKTMEEIHVAKSVLDKRKHMKIFLLTATKLNDIHTQLQARPKNCCTKLRVIPQENC
jgi:hypothetical protein